ncbi:MULTISPECIES: DUF4153 domain-containing protein [Bifidobacterium]|uniref:DUF4153 domain-containing protein n=1 Tax=Bifidobacterium TaxID=1678 RepID=UPI001BDC5B50|nr:MULTISPECIES: DUF4173 domain-containing protein [Bifidobacterium]MBT1162331.1 DUF4173 domain-containing protein [Bifidobacterium sp. SO1]MBW3078817.1 DUF4173 domain-containing protein [Bifidobacterium simiiventris]
MSTSRHESAETQPGDMVDTRPESDITSTGKTSGPQPSDTASVSSDARPTATTGQSLEPRTILLFAVSFAIPMLFDRIVLAGLQSTYGRPRMTSLLFAAFWLSCVVIVTALHWRAARRRPLTWFTAAAIAALAAWLVMSERGIFSDNPEYGFITALCAIPSLLMLHAQLVNGRYDVRHPFGIMLRWLTGWLIQPFAGLGRFGRAVSSAVHVAANSRQRPIMRRIGIALLIAVPVLAVLVALLSSADMVVSYGISRLFGDLDLTSLLMHALAVLLPMPFLFSLLDNQERSDGEMAAWYGRSVSLSLDTLVTAIVLGLVLVVYAMFCAVQFTFLFAGEGLPGGLTYAEYARSGFFQLLFVAAVNLAVFGLVLTYARRTRAIEAMLVGLIAATGVMLASAATRLGLYVDAYGLTWLRFVSLTFIGLLAVMLALCLVRMRTARLPLIATCFALFVVWYVALGYCDPTALIERYNMTHGFSPFM